MKNQRFTIASLGLLIATTAVMLGPTQVDGQEVLCLLCLEWVENEEPDPAKKPEWQWYHYFDPDSGPACAADPAEMCRACGGTSECHLPGHPDEGACHRSECPTSYLTLLEIGTTMTNLASHVDDRTGPILAQTIAREPRLAYDETLRAVKLTRCDGTVAGTWYLGRSAQPYLSADVVEGG